jgi:FkbM family methyltransferase
MPSQLWEDDILDAVFASRREGFYIDVGASDPIIDSVTERFYNRGWRGVNVEPRIDAVERLERMRPRDRNVRGIVSDVDGEQVFYLISYPLDNVEQRHRFDSVSSMDPACIIPALKANRVVQCALMRSYTLDFLFAENATGVDVHFLKIDVEGAETKAIAGWDRDKWRPWTLCIEANSDAARDSWEPMLTSKGYTFVGQYVVNRYYVALERGELGPPITAKIATMPMHDGMLPILPGA